MKIGILTFHRADNYGAVLQCYALCNAIKLLGFNDVQVIDYYPTYFTDEYSLFSYKKFLNSSLRGKLGMVKEFILFCVPKILRRRKFSLFVMKKLQLSSRMNEHNVSFSKYDVVFIGSDQVWNKKLTNGHDKAFAGDIRTSNMVLVSYAASTEFHKEINRDLEYYKNLSRNFDAISLRENVLVEFFNTFTDIPSKWVLDPTLLLTKEQWSGIIQLPKEKNYLLVYTVPQDPAVMELAHMIAEREGLQIIELVSKVRYIYKKNCHQIVSPEQFIGYFNHASYVVTTSFHGTAFSLVMQKQFCTLMLGRPVDVRARDLLHNLDLESRCIPYNDLHIPSDEIDFANVERKFSRLKEESYGFIMNTINKASKDELQ